MCTYLQPINNTYIEKGVGQKVNKLKMNIQQEAKKGVSQSQKVNQRCHEYPTGGGPCQKGED